MENNFQKALDSRPYGDVNRCSEELSLTLKIVDFPTIVLIRITSLGEICLIGTSIRPFALNIVTLAGSKFRTCPLIPIAVSA